MPVLMKDKYYNYDSLHDLASRIKAVFPSFQENDFVDHIMNETWDALELKARMRQITINLGKYLPSDYKQALGIIDQVVAGYPSGYNDYALIYFPDFVEVNGRHRTIYPAFNCGACRKTVYYKARSAHDAADGCLGQA